MRRRDFVTFLSGAMAWIHSAHAQEPRRVIGALRSSSSTSIPGSDATFLQGLADAGFIEGKNISIEWRWTEGQYDRLPSLARELVGRDVAVLVHLGRPRVVSSKGGNSSRLSS